MSSFHVVKLFDLDEAPDEVRTATETAALHDADPALGIPMLTVLVGSKSSAIQRPDGEEATSVTEWEHKLHAWLVNSGAIPGDVVFLMWSTTPAAQSDPDTLRTFSAPAQGTPCAVTLDH